MTGKSLNLEFYSLIRIGFSDLTGEVEAAVMRHFGSFRVDQDREGRPQDIAVSELRGEAAAALDPFNREDTSGFWIKELGDDVYAVFGHRGRADVAIRLSSSLSSLHAEIRLCQ